MTSPVVIALVTVFLGGCAVALQVPINAVLGRAADSFIVAAGVSFGIGFVALFALAAARGSLGSLSTLGSLPWWVWTGGLLGAYFVWANASSVGTLGVVSVVAAVVLGQMSMALVLDSIGAFGVPPQPVTWQRVTGIVMVLGGLILSRF